MLLLIIHQHFVEKTKDLPHSRFALGRIHFFIDLSVFFISCKAAVIRIDSLAFRQLTIRYIEQHCEQKLSIQPRVFLLLLVLLCNLHRQIPVEELKYVRILFFLLWLGYEQCVKCSGDRLFYVCSLLVGGFFLPYLHN